MDDLIRRLTSRRSVLTGVAALAAAACTSSSTGREVDTRDGRSGYPADEPVTDQYRQEEITGAVENFFGVTSQGAAEVVERVFGDLGRPNAYIAGEEAALAVAVGLRYGEGWLYRRNKDPLQVFWTGPSVGFDVGANASKCFTLVYNLGSLDELFRRFRRRGQLLFHRRHRGELSARRRGDAGPDAHRGRRQGRRQYRLRQYHARARVGAALSLQGRASAARAAAGSIAPIAGM